MARARNIKPAFFENEILAELEAFDRLLFIGLWCLADREGRLEDRPKRIKMSLFPCDSYDVAGGLSALELAGFVSRYDVDGFSVVEILNFSKHQNPHGSEKDSILPDVNGFLTVNERVRNVVVSGRSRKVHVKDALVNVKTPLENALIPDSLNLIPDSPIPEEKSPCPQQADDGPAKEKIPFEKIRMIYNDVCKGVLSEAIKLDDKRKRNIRKCWAMSIAGATPFQSGEFWRQYFTDCLDDAHWTGGNEKGWRADIEFLTRESSVLKVLERT